MSRFADPEMAAAGHQEEDREDDRARLAELSVRIDALLDAGEWHEARRLTIEARNLSRRVYGDPLITARANGGRTSPNLDGSPLSRGPRS
ncbi:MAG: hypothetical protein WAK93_16410 [Solirubrobacteraceae bacterium]